MEIAPFLCLIKGGLAFGINDNLHGLNFVRNGHIAGFRISYICQSGIFIFLPL